MSPPVPLLVSPDAGGVRSARAETAGGAVATLVGVDDGAEVGDQVELGAVDVDTGHKAL